MPTGNAYLFCWNPEKWPWVDLEKEINAFRKKGEFSRLWSCVSHKQIKPGDRAFLLKLGVHPKGIFASGYISDWPSLKKHWNGENRTIPAVSIQYDFFLHPLKDSLLSLDLLNQGNLKNYNWTPQGSGVIIKPGIAKNLDEAWFNFVTRNKYAKTTSKYTKSLEQDRFKEGKTKQIVLTGYERNPLARKACIDFYGLKCAVCLFEFEKFYGQVGKNFIHVHHLNLISKIKSTYEVDPIKDLRPVCPNCHAMLHRENPPLSIEKLQSLIPWKKRTSK